MIDFTALKNLIAGQSDPLAYLRELVPVDAGQIPRRDLKLVLLGRGKLDAVIAAFPTFANDPDFSTIRVSDSLTQAVFGQLVAGNVLNADDVAALNALGTVPVPRWQAAGLEREPDFGDIDRANAE